MLWAGQRKLSKFQRTRTFKETVGWEGSPLSRPALLFTSWFWTASFAHRSTFQAVGSESSTATKTLGTRTGKGTRGMAAVHPQDLIALAVVLNGVRAGMGLLPAGSVWFSVLRDVELELGDRLERERLRDLSALPRPAGRTPSLACGRRLRRAA